jgi:hypothetical protein
VSKAFDAVALPQDIFCLFEFESGCFSTQKEISPLNRREKSYSWRLGVLTFLVKTGVVGVLIVFSDYKSDYFAFGCSDLKLIKRSDLNFTALTQK